MSAWLDHAEQMGGSFGTDGTQVHVFRRGEFDEDLSGVKSRRLMQLTLTTRSAYEDRRQYALEVDDARRLGEALLRAADVWDAEKLEEVPDGE